MEPLDLDCKHLRQLSIAPPTTVRRPPAQQTNTALPNSELQREKSSSNVHHSAVCVCVCIRACVCVCTSLGGDHGVILLTG